MGDRGSMKEVFVQCQTGLQGHGKLMKTLQKIYDKTEFETFWSEFHHYLKYAMIVFKREPAVERMIDFVSKFAPSLYKKSTDKVDAVEDGDTSQETEDSVSDNRLLQEMFDFLLSSHSARDRGVRFRCCQLINKLLTNLGEDAQIDDELYDRLYECMLERLKDKCPMVRYHAVLAMARLQDPTDENCPVIKAYLFLLNYDPNADVRRAVLFSIAPSTKTLSSILGRTRDVKDTVRKTAYEVLAEKIHIKALSIALRLQLINEGLKDRSDMVQQACSGKLLKAWMRTFGGNILELLKSLDVEDSTDVCSKVLETLFKVSTVQDMIVSFSILDDQLLIPLESLTSESALYWQAVCKYIHAMGNEGDEYMEKVMPTVVDFCAYLQRYIDDLKAVEDPEIQLGREFVIEQLLLITSYMDTADAASKKALETLLHNMLMADHVSHRLVKPILVRICAVRGNGESLVPYFAETVSEIREPITLIEKDIEEEQKRQINLKIAGIRVRLNQLREDLDGAVKEQDFGKAAEIKGAIAQLDGEKKQLLETSEPVREEVRTEKNDPLTLLKCQTIISEMLQQLKLASVSSTLQMLIESQIVPGIQNEDDEVRNMAMQALGLCCYLSKDLLVTYIPLFIQASQIDVEGVRVTALQILFDLLLLYGLEIVDASETDSSDKTANTESLTSDTASASSDSRSGTASKLVAIICSFLDGESSDLRTCAAEGLSKLMLSGRVVSSKILSHLILLWYNPLSEDDTHLRDCLGTFFPLYALASRISGECAHVMAVVLKLTDWILEGMHDVPSQPACTSLPQQWDKPRGVRITSEPVSTMVLSRPGNTNRKKKPVTAVFIDSRSNQELVEEAFLPTLRTLLNAPATSPLAEVDVNNVAELLVQLTNTKLLTANQNSTELSLMSQENTSLSDNPGHDNLSETVCNEILSKPESMQVKLWVRILNQMEVSPDNEVVLKDLRILAYKMVKIVKDKSCLKALQKFQSRINELASKFVTDNDDLQNIEIEEENVEEGLDTTLLTPKRKRVRGLYSQNLTLAMESESELDLVDDSSVDVDASCLMSRISVDTPSRRSRKNTTTTELTEEDVFVAPNEPEPSVNEESTMREKENARQKKADVPEEQEVQSPKGKTPEKKKDGGAGKNKSPRSKSPDKRGRPAAKKTASPKKAGKKSPEKVKDKRKASRSPAEVSPEKRLASESPGRRSQEKRKASKSPLREKKRMSTSPARSASESSRGSNSPKKSLKSPVRKAGEKKVKSPPKVQKNNTSESPGRGTTDKRKSQASPSKSLRKDASASPAPAKKAKENEKPSKEIKNPAKKIADADKAQTKAKPNKEQEGKKNQSPERKKSASKIPAIKEKKEPERSIRKAQPKSVESAKLGKTRSEPSVAKSPRAARVAKLGDSAIPKPSNSPQKASRAGSKIVADTPEPVTRRATRSVQSTPDVRSPSARQVGKTSVAETPEHSDEGKALQNASSRNPTSARVVLTRHVASNSVVRSTRSASSASESSPEKSERRTRGKAGSSVDSSTSSPGSAKGKKQKTVRKPSPVQNRTLEFGTTTDEDEEEVPLKRKAKPSRRSATASASMSAVATPTGTVRVTRASLSQSTVSSPATASPQQPRPGVPVSKVTRKEQTPTSKQPVTKAPVHRSTRGVDSSQGSSSLSLISSQQSARSSPRSATSSQRSTISSQRSTASSLRSTTSSLRSTASSVAGKNQGSEVSRPSGRTTVTTSRTASTRSLSADSNKMKKAVVSKVTRSAVATTATRGQKAEPGNLRRPLRSRQSEK